MLEPRMVSMTGTNSLQGSSHRQTTVLRLQALAKYFVRRRSPASMRRIQNFAARGKEGVQHKVVGREVR